MRLDVQDSGSMIKRTMSRCPRCLDKIPAVVHERDGRVVMMKSCPAHGDFEVTLAADRRFYYLATGSRGQPSCGDRTSSIGGSVGGSNGGGGGGCDCSTETSSGRADDPFEVLSTCLALIEIVDSCNLTCPSCYSASPWGIDDNVDCIDVDAFVERVQGVIDRKGSIDILQLSGGEPTIHPRFFDILDWALEHVSIGYVLVNTNGVRISRDPVFRERLAAARRTHGKLELYVQAEAEVVPGGRDETTAAGEHLRRPTETARGRCVVDLQAPIARRTVARRESGQLSGGHVKAGVRHVERLEDPLEQKVVEGLRGTGSFWIHAHRSIRP